MSTCPAGSSRAWLRGAPRSPDRRRTTARGPLACLVAVLLVLVACASRERRLAEVRATDTPAAYEAFLREEQPAGEIGEKARERLRALREEEAWRSAATADTREAYERFLADYQASGRVPGARARIAELLVRDALTTETEPGARAAAERGLVELGEAAIPAMLAALASGEAAARGELVPVLVRIGQVRVAPLVDALRHESADVRAAAAETLGRIGDPVTLSPLVGATRDESADVRQAAIAALTRMSGPAVEALLPGLRDRDPLARRSAATALGRLRAEPAIRPLIGLLADPDREARRAASAALAVIGEPAGPALVATLRHLDPRMREGAALVLGLMAYRDAIEPLAGLADDPDPGVQQAARTALAQTTVRLLADLRSSSLVARAAAVEGLVRMGPPVLPTLLATLREGDPLLRRGAAAALGGLRVPSASAPLAGLLRDEDEEVRGAAGDALVKIGAPAVEAVLLGVRSADGQTRDRARAVLRRLPADEVVPPLVATLAEGEAEPSTRAAETLVAIGAGAVAPLAPFLDDPRYAVRRAVADILGRIGDPGAIMPLLRAHRNPTVRSWAVGALAAIGAVDETAAALGDADPLIRAAAAEALGEMPGLRSGDALVVALRDADGDVRRAAARALARLQSPAAVPTLLAWLRDADERTRDAAVDALVTLEAAAMDAVLSAADDRDPRLRAVVTRVLARVTDARAAPALVRLLRDREAAVRRASADALATRGGDAIPALLAAARGADRGERLLLADVLAGIREPAAIAWLRDAAGDRDPIVRERAAAGLGKQHAAEATEVLIALLEDPDTRVREAAGRAIAAIGPPAVEALLESAGDDAGRVRAVAAAVGIGAEAAPALARALHDPRRGVRVAAADALGELREEGSVPALLAALQDGDAFVQWRVAWALEMFGPDVQPARAAVDAFLATEGADLGSIARDVRPAVRQGQDGAVILALERYGTPEMAEAILRMAPRMRAAVERWARLGGHALSPPKRPPAKPRPQSTRPSPPR